jgi:hypothetical protein
MVMKPSLTYITRDGFARFAGLDAHIDVVKDRDSKTTAEIEADARAVAVAQFPDVYIVTPDLEANFIQTKADKALQVIISSLEDDGWYFDDPVKQEGILKNALEKAGLLNG